MSALDRRSLLTAGAAFAAGGTAWAAPPQPTPGQTVQIDGRTVHLATADPGWRLLNSARVTSDRRRGVMLAAFPDPLKAQDGHSLTIGGFIVPLVAEPRFDRFLLTKTNYACGFCPPPAPTEVIEVRLARQRIAATLDEIKVRGRLELVGSSADSVFYRLHEAAVV